MPAMPSVPSLTPGCRWSVFITSASPNRAGALRISSAVILRAPISLLSTAGLSSRDVTTTSRSIVAPGADTGTTEGAASTCVFIFRAAFFLRVRITFLPFMRKAMPVSRNMASSTLRSSRLRASTVTLTPSSTSEEYTKFMPVCSMMRRNTEAAASSVACTVTFCAAQPSAMHAAMVRNTSRRLIPQRSFVCRVFH